MKKEDQSRQHDLRIKVTPEGDVHVFGVGNVVIYGNIRSDGTRLITNVDNNCPNTDEGRQVIKLVHTEATDKPLALQGGEAAIKANVNTSTGKAVLHFRNDGGPNSKKNFNVVGSLELRS